MRLAGLRTIPALLDGITLEFQESWAPDGPLPPGAIRGRHRPEGQARESLRMQRPVVKGHLLEATRLGSLQLEEHRAESISPYNLLL